LIIFTSVYPPVSDISSIFSPASLCAVHAINFRIVMLAAGNNKFWEQSPNQSPKVSPRYFCIILRHGLSQIYSLVPRIDQHKEIVAQQIENYYELWWSQSILKGMISSSHQLMPNYTLNYKTKWLRILRQRNRRGAVSLEIYLEVGTKWCLHSLNLINILSTKVSNGLFVKRECG
jgi:hypothetical protein